MRKTLKWKLRRNFLIHNNNSSDFTVLENTDAIVKFSCI